MIGACELRPARAGCGIRIAFRDSARVRLSPGSSVILTPASSPSRAGQKNRLWDLRAASARVVRPQTAQGPGSRLRRPADLPRPRVIGLDEVSLRKGHTYRIVVTDLIRKRAIWFGGTDRSEASLDAFFAWLGPRK